MKSGRKKNGHNKGYWFRKGRGWYAGTERLLADGKPITDEADREVAEKAFYLLKANGTPSKPQSNGLTVREACREYLAAAAKLVGTSGKTGITQETYGIRKGYLVDFCEGVSKSGKRIHKGYGDLSVAELNRSHIKAWLDAHNWNGSKRIAYQSIRRAIQWRVDEYKATENPIKGFKFSEPTHKRLAYFTTEVEQAIYDTANRSLADVVRAMIRTGSRPGEVARLEKQHIKERDGRMIWQFSKQEHKTGRKTERERAVYVCSEIAALVKERTSRQTGDRVFLNSRGRPWTSLSLKIAFCALRKRLVKKGVWVDEKGVELNEDHTIYAARHTYAKRQLAKGVSIEVLAGQMGNSPKVAWEHYGKTWTDQSELTPILWTGID